jgi:hypothetical protein
MLCITNLKFHKSYFLKFMTNNLTSLLFSVSFCLAHLFESAADITNCQPHDCLPLHVIIIIAILHVYTTMYERHRQQRQSKQSLILPSV